MAELHIPPLNDRREDIPLLFEHFVQELATRHARDVARPSREDMQGLVARDWRGNVRELRNIAERFVLQLGPQAGVPGTDRDSARRLALPEQLDAVESTLIRVALAEHGGNVQVTADALGIPRRTLNEKMRKHGLERKEFQ